MADLAWEDGVYITRDGLTLYAFYEPADVLKAVLDGATPDLFYKYQRGTLIGQDFSNPLMQPTPWLHADIAYSQRATTADSFTSWTLSNLKTQYYNRGAAQGILNGSDPTVFDFFVFTDDSGSGNKIRLLTSVVRNPSGPGVNLPSNVDEPAYNQDNPHLERYDPLDPNKLVLFFESNNKPGGAGGHDIWYSISADSGSTWTNPQNVTSINTVADELQPHLYFEATSTSWWLYFSGINPADGKLAIFRAKQGTPNDWNSWQSKQLVVSAGTSAGVGEPTLTSLGDLSFVVITNNTTTGTPFDQNDADPWFMKRK